MTLDGGNRERDVRGFHHSLVEESYPNLLSQAAISRLKPLFLRPGASVDSIAHSICRRVNAEEGRTTTRIPEDDVLFFLSHVMEHAITSEHKDLAAKVLNAYEHLQETREQPPRKVYIARAPASEWQWTYLEHLGIDFQNVDLAEFGIATPLDVPATTFLNSNASLSYNRLIDKEFLGKHATAFERFCWFVQHQPEDDDHVDDMVGELLSEIFRTNENAFVVKRKLDLPLVMSEQQGAPETPKNAIIDVILLQIKESKLRYGVIIVEDKVRRGKATNATAQMIVDAIAAAQTEANRVIYMLLVRGHVFSFYKAFFSEEFISYVEVGRRRTDTFLVQKGVGRDELHTGLVGSMVKPGDYDIFIQEERRVIVQTLWNIRAELDA
ncbi:hypothetical protein HK097_001802 [Rhizophlyctis rosea]|uniref:Uncharacterized protein n=1 Tax=Rhizophlyctis rosea TaxID=64517 RepID=A0AAD5S676_9FUNG|nr:hypothetical protein HK097_001802 [Rhizophlyctis rosea]